MSNDEMRFHVRVDPERVDIRVLESSIAAFARLVRATGAEKWTVSDLRLASIEAAVRPSEATIDFEFEFARLADGFASLTQVARPPAGWTDDMLDSVADLRQLIDAEGVEGVELTLGEQHTLEITTEVVQNAASAMSSTPPTLGAVTGKVDRFIDRAGRRNFGLVDEATGDAVTVRFTSQREDDVLRLLGRRITAWGSMRRTPGGKKKELVLEGLEPVDLPEGPPPSVDDVTGILGADWTDGQTSVDWVRGQRGDD